MFPERTAVDEVNRNAVITQKSKRGFILNKKFYYHLRRKAKLFFMSKLLKYRQQPEVRPWKLKTKRVLIFCPEAAIRPHFDSMQTLGQMIQNGGAEVRWVRCDGAMLRCPAHDMDQVPWDQDQSSAKTTTCVQCRWHANGFRGLGIERSISWDRYLSPPPILRFTSAMQKKSWRDFCWKGIRFGELATAATRMLLKKEPGRMASLEYRNYWAMTYRASIQSFEGMARLAAEWKPDLLLHYDQYPVLISARIAAEKAGVSVRTVGHTLLNGIDRGKVQFFESTYNKMIRRLAEGWPRYSRQPVSWDQVKVSSEDLISRMRGGHTHVYSRPLGDHEELHFYRDLMAKGKNILIAFTSSEDEVGAELAISRALRIREKKGSSAFADQAEWLGWLQTYASSSRHHVAVRIHPREGGNSRNPRASENLARLKKKLGQGSANFSVIWPDSPISSYDLFHIAHAVSVSFTSIGLEAARSGIPVVTPFGPPVYEHPSLAMLRRVQSRREYRNLLDAWMDGPLFLDPHAWIDVFRWHFLITGGSSLELNPKGQLKVSDLLNIKLPTLSSGGESERRESPKVISQRIASELSKFFVSRCDAGMVVESALLKRLQCQIPKITR